MRLLKDLPNDLSVLSLFRIFREGKMKLPLVEYENMEGLTRESFKILEKEGYVHLFTGEYDEETGTQDAETMLYCFLTKDGLELYRELRLKNLGYVKQFFLNLKSVIS